MSRLKGLYSAPELALKGYFEEGSCFVFIPK